MAVVMVIVTRFRCKMDRHQADDAPPRVRKGMGGVRNHGKRPRQEAVDRLRRSDQEIRCESNQERSPDIDVSLVHIIPRGWLAFLY